MIITAIIVRDYQNAPELVAGGVVLLRQTAQHTAQLIRQSISVWAVDQAGKQLVQLIEILVAEMNADRYNPGALQGTQVRQGEIPIGYGAGAKDGFAVVDDQQDMQAFWAGAQLGFRLAQAPIQVFLARPAGVAGDQRLGQLAVVGRERGDFGHRLLNRDAVGRQGRVAGVEVILAEVRYADRDARKLLLSQVDPAIRS